MCIRDRREVERLYNTFTAHKVDLSKYIGKEIRLAFRDRSVDQFNLFIGQMLSLIHIYRSKRLRYIYLQVSSPLSLVRLSLQD